MLTLTTGLPGNSKTLYRLYQTIKEVKEQEQIRLKKGLKKPDVFICNFQNFTDHDLEDRLCSPEAVGLAFDPTHSLYNDVKDWKVASIEDITKDIHLVMDNLHPVISQGSIIIIDECQDLYPTRSANKALPEFIKFFEKHRHAGLNFHLITQAPRQIDIHVRSLINYHYELDRHGKAEFSNVRISPKGILDDCPKDLIKTDVFKYPKSYYGLYKSAVQHTQTDGFLKFLSGLPTKAKIVFVAAFLFISWGIYSISTGGLNVLSEEKEVIKGSVADSSLTTVKSSPLGLNASTDEEVPLFYLTYYFESMGKDYAFFNYLLPSGASIDLTSDDLKKMDINFETIRPGVYLINGAIVPNFPLSKDSEKEDKEKK